MCVFPYVSRIQFMGKINYRKNKAGGIPYPKTVPRPCEISFDPYPLIYKNVLGGGGELPYFPLPPLSTHKLLGSVSITSNLIGHFCSSNWKRWQAEIFGTEIL